MDAFKRIPFEEGPYYLFKNTFPLYVKHILGPFTAFYSFDWLVDKLSVLWRASNMPILPCKIFAAGLGTYLGCVFSYPFSIMARNYVDFLPKKNGVDPFDGNYRKAAVFIWFSPQVTSSWYGMFKTYFWHVAPQYYLSHTF